MGKRTSQEEFIAKANKKHGVGHFDYSMVEYTHCLTPVTIKCNICGTVFQVRPSVHLYGKGGCPTCAKKAMSRAITHEEFVRRATKVHHGKYDYSQSVYRGWDNFIEIRCPEHGVFKQKAGCHIKGSEGCPECLKTKRSVTNALTTEQFIARARKVHGNKYGYDKVEYKDTFTEVIITCPIHGDFKQKPYNHIAGHECYWCSRESQANKMTISQEDFIRRANEVHHGYYDYSKTNFRNTTGIITITCPKHGDFTQLAHTHLAGHGCPECGKETWLEQVTKSKRDFIQQARDMHGNRYDYSLVDYVNSSTKVKIICKKHGVFEMTPNGHLHWQGCPVCCISYGEKRIMRFLERHGIEYKYQHRVPYDKPPMKSHFRIDVYVPAYNMFIEFNGKQHYMEVKPWKYNRDLAVRQARDEALRKFCEQQNIRLLMIHYKDFDNIEAILDRELKL